MAHGRHPDRKLYLSNSHKPVAPTYGRMTGSPQERQAWTRATVRLTEGIWNDHENHI